MINNTLNQTIQQCGFKECSQTWLGSVSLWSSIIAVGELLLIIILIKIIFHLIKKPALQGAPNV